MTPGLHIEQGIEIFAEENMEKVPSAKYVSWLLGILGLVLFGLMGDCRAQPDAPAALSGPDHATRVRIQKGFGKLPLYFIENGGQTDSRVSYYVQGADKTLYFTSQSLVLVLRGKDEASSSYRTGIQRVAYSPGHSRSGANDTLIRWALKLDFVGANPGVRPVGLDQTPAVISYFKGSRGQWKTGLKTYASVIYRDLWPGIDMVYTGTVNRLKYTFLVRPGADPGVIRLAYQGATAVTVSDKGQLEVKTPVGGFLDDRPYTYQEVNGQRVEVATDYTLKPYGSDGARVYGFKLGSYDKTKPLVLDPAVLVYCGYIGGSGNDLGYGIAVDAAGNAYVTGITYSSEGFPVTVGPDLTYNDDNNSDAFVAKVNASGTSLVYCGYIGGSGGDSGNAIAVDGAGNAYITGSTLSDEDEGFPVTVGPDLTFNYSYSDAFVAKVNASGTSLLYCGYIGGNDKDYGNAIAVDGAGNAYVTGTTSSSKRFPVTVGPDLTHNGYGQDAFVAKVNASGTSLVYCGYIGGSDDDAAYGIAVDGVGNAYVTGRTESDETWDNFPVLNGPDLSYNYYGDAFVAKVNASGTSLVYCGYIGGSGYGYDGDCGTGIAVDAAGYAYITGYTDSSQADGFPVTVGPDLTYNGWSDAFVAKVNTSGTSFVYCGYIGGDYPEAGRSIAVDGAGNAYLTGYTYSSESTFPVTEGPDLTFNDYYSEAFVAKVNASGTRLVYCGYIGGYYEDIGNGIAVDSAGNAYVTGSTHSPQSSFPVTVGPDLTYNGGQYDTFVAKISATTCPDCSGSTVVLKNITFSSGWDCECVGTESITIGPGVTIKNGARVTIKAPKVKVQSGFHAEEGAVVHIRQE